MVHGIIKNKKINYYLKSLNKHDHLILHQENIFNSNSIKKLILKLKPSEIYYLATTHELPTTINNFYEVFSINVHAFLNMLDIVKEYMNKTKIFYSSSSNVFSGTKVFPQTENTKMKPTTLYGTAKLTAMNIIDMYRDNFKVFVCYGILYNHESFLRKKNFLPMKIVDAAVNISFGLQKKLYIGNLEDMRDWGAAEDYVKAMWLMLQKETPSNYIIGSGKLRSVKDLIEIVFGYLNLDWRSHIKIDKKLTRTIEKVTLLSNPKKIYNDLGWKSQIQLKEVLIEMIKNDINRKKNSNV